MNIGYRAYAFLTTLLMPAVIPGLWLYSRFTGRLVHLKERLGILPRTALLPPAGSPRIWIHAASLGEVRVAVSLVQALRRFWPDASIVVSTMTEHGRNLAVTSLDREIPVIFAPLDFVPAVRRALGRIRPHAMVFLETEIWPAWICESHRLGVKTMLVNGRLSSGSLRRYLRLRPFFTAVLEKVDGFSMISSQHGARVVAMGAAPGKVRVNGNAKYDMLAQLTHPDIPTRMRGLFNLPPDSRVLVAGSTRRGEEPILLDAYQRIREQFPDTVLILAPRHVVRTRQVMSLLRRRGVRCQLRTDLGDGKAQRFEPVVILNTLGDLFAVYSIATVAFCGGSLVPLGGQNPLEPAAWGKVVCYGPHMDNFLDATAVLEEAEAGIAVPGARVLADQVLWFFSHPRQAEAVGQRAREAVWAQQGAADRHVHMIASLLPGTG